MTHDRSSVSAVAIGRNEGDRLVQCLASLKDEAAHVVYVDSGSTDGSVEVARSAGAEVVELDLSIPFTAARARNAGVARLKEIKPDVAYIQLLDSDCEIVPGWMELGRQTLENASEIAVVCGRRREKFPDATMWNGMIDREWAAAPGDVKACGGDALMRRDALDQVGGYSETMIAGEEPEMCFRMRQKGWKIHRLDAEMTRHDAALTKFSQWWQRSRRTGHTWAEGAALHGKSPERYLVAQLRRTMIWGMGIPGLAILGAVLISPWALLVLLAWPLQAVRLGLKGMPWVDAIFLTIGKLAEAQGVLGYWKGRISGQRRTLIEYK